MNLFSFVVGFDSFLDDPQDEYVINCIFEEMKKMFLIKQCEDSVKVNDYFRDLINNLTHKQLLDENSLNVSRLGISLKKLDKYYQKDLDVEDLDERFFIKDRKKHLTPSKFTPFTK